MKTLTQVFAVLLAVATLIACGSHAAPKKEEAVLFNPLKERAGALAQTAEWAGIKEQVANLFKKIAADPNDLKSKLLLAQIYIQEARVTGEHPYYYPAATGILDDVLKHDPANFEALAFKASVQLSLHHFKEALETGTRAKAINGNNGFIYGVLCDANVELGNYEEAVKMSDMMQGIRPGLESYSRASYLREIYGNNEGAIEAMKMAYKAGMPSSEEASWAGYTLGHLLESTGDMKHAEEIYNIVLTQRPSYAFALNGLGMVEMAKGNYSKAIVHFEKAAAMMPEFSFYQNIADAYQGMGKPEMAKGIYANVIEMLKEDAASGHDADLELSIAYLKAGNTEKALEHARTEYARRPNNIDVNQALAWSLYKSGNVKEAKKHMLAATRMGTSNAVLLCKAGIIETAAGNKKTGQEWIRKALQINPRLPADLLAVAKSV